MVGNQGAFDMVSGLRDQFGAQQKTIDAQAQGLQILLKAKTRNDINELVKRSRHANLYTAVRQTGNQETYGADIEFHRYIISLTGYDEAILAACTEGFETTYGISLGVYDSHFREAPENIVQIVNQRGDFYFLHAYTRSSRHLTEIADMRTLCDEIIGLWIANNGTISEEITAKICRLNELQNLWEEGESRDELRNI